MRITEMMKLKKLLMALALLPLMAMADTETVDGITWTYTISADGASVGNGWDSAIPPDTSGAITIPPNLGGRPVTDIGSYAFANLYDLESVEIPNTVKSIGEGSFYACSFLDDLEVPDSVEAIGIGAFEDCSWMQTISIGRGVRWIEDDAFKGCSNLQKVMLPEGLESIGKEAFAGCWRMQSVSLPMTLQEVDSSAFTGCSSLTGVTTPTHRGTMADWFSPVRGQIREVTIPCSESLIAVNAFSNCTSLVKVSFAKTPTSGAWQGVTEIGDGAFYNCRSLVDIELPHSLVRIGRQAFRNCTALPAISLPACVQQIGEYAFCSCSSLKDLAFSESLTAIPDYAFYGCDNLDSFTVPESVNYLGSRFVGCGNSWQGTSAVYYLGNAPTYAEDAYAASRSDLKSYVILGTRGWDGRVSSRDIPQSWPVANSYSRGILTWSPNPFDVTFDACGGIFANDGSSSYACQQITYTAYALPPYNPKREGCVFDGWWTEIAGGTRVTASTRVSLAKAHTLYAHWIVGGNVLVRFNATGGTVSPESGVYQTGKPYGELPVPTREYWDFAGWWTEVSGGTQILPGSEVAAADVELFAHWYPARYKIVFHSVVSRYSWEDEETYTQEFTYGETVTLRGNPFTSYGLTFAGWATERGGLAVYADRKTLSEITDIRDGVIDLYAVWIGDQYVIRFDSNGGYGVMPNQTCFIGVYQQLSSNLFTRAGYVFDGWSRTKTGRREYSDMKSVLNLSTVRNDTVVLYAVWKEISYCTVTFNANGGKCDETTRKVREGDAVGELPVPTREGYVFRCWTTGSSGGTVLSPDSTISYSRTYYALWERAERVRISFDANGGRIGDHVKETHVGNFTVLGKLIPTATWTGYVFLGWFTEPEGGVQVSESTEVSADVTFYAHWRLLNQPVSVVFDPQGGQCSKTNVTGISGKAISTLPTYSRVGYTFDGWYTAPEGGTKITAQTKVAEDVTYYAHATPITYKVRFNPNCGTGKMEDQSFVYDQEQSLTTNSFELSSHTFVGWSMAASGKMSIKDLIWDEQSVSNLCARQGATIDLYAVWMRTSSIRESTYNTVKKYDPEDPEDYWFEWSSEVTLKRGTSHLFWMTPEDPESVLLMDVWSEDDEWWWLGPSEWFDKENEDGTVTTYLLLTAEDWEGFDKSSACFTVRVEGLGGPESFRFCHREVDCDISVKWDVRFDAVEGECVERWREVAHNKAIGTLPTPTRSKYKFNGWYTAAEGGTKISATTKVQGDVIYYAQWTYDGSATVVVNVGSGCEGMGTVSGGKTAKAGTKVTLKATAKAGYVFAGWYRDAAGEEPVEGGTDYRSPSYSYVVGEDDATFYAKFISVDEDWVSVWCQPDDEYARGVEIEPLEVEVYSESLPTVKVTGLPTGLKFTAKAMTLKATNNRAAVDLPANTIYGTPTKSGIYTATITATTAGKKSETYKVDFVVRGDGEYLVDVMGLDGADYPTNGSDMQHAIQWGKMSGYGVFKPDKTATLKATANKGYVFAGWFSEVACVCAGGEEDDGCVYTPAAGTVDYRSTSFPVKVGHEDVLYYARFVRAEDDDRLYANVEDAYYLNGAWSLTLDIESLSLPTVTVKGLPSGLKFDAKTLTISGAPTKPGTYPITLSLKNKTITKARTQTFTLHVANIESPYLVGVDYSSDAYSYSVGSDVRLDLGSCVCGGYSISAVSGLPKGLLYNKAMGMIEGCPTQDGAYTVSIVLKNGRQSSNATLTMNVSWVEENFSLRLYRYVAVQESLPLKQYGDGLSFEKPQGSLPSGINVLADAQRNVMTINGIPTSSGNFQVTYILNVQKSGKKIPCAKMVLQMEVVDPTQVGTGKDGAALNASCVKPRTFEDLMIFAKDDELGADNAKRLLGTLQLTLPATGKASAKFLCESGTVSFAAKSWDKIDLEGGSLETTLVGTTKNFRDWALNVTADSDGGVRLWISSPSATYNTLDFGKTMWSKTHSAADYSGYYTVTLAPATDDAGEPIVTGAGRAYAPVGSGYLTLKMMSSLEANSGMVTWAGSLPNGTTMSGRGVLTEMSEKTAWLPMVQFSAKDKFAGVVEVERGAAAAAPDADCWESVLTPTWNETTVRTWWRHTEAVPKTDKNEFTVRYEPYGGIYDSKYDLNCCCEMMGGLSTMSLTVDVPSSFVSDYYGRFAAVDPIDVAIGAHSLSCADSMGGSNKITLSYNKSAGIVSGKFDLHYTDAKTLADEKLTATYGGVIQLGCGDKCGYGISLPFVKGFWCVADKIGYQKDDVSGEFKKWLSSVKRGGAFTIELVE